MTQNSPREDHSIAVDDGRGRETVITAPSADLVREGNRMLLCAAVARRVICPFTDTLLDVTDAVLIDIPGHGTTVMAAGAWDKISARVTAKHPAVEVIDGRAL